jgi:hypothetical protein
MDYLHQTTYQHPNLVAKNHAEPIYYTDVHPTRFNSTQVCDVDHQNVKKMVKSLVNPHFSLYNSRN